MLGLGLWHLVRVRALELGLELEHLVHLRRVCEAGARVGEQGPRVTRHAALRALVHRVQELPVVSPRVVIE